MPWSPPLGPLQDVGMSIDHRPERPIAKFRVEWAVVTALIVIGGSVLVSACSGGGNDSDMPVEVAEVDLTELDVEMHYAVG